MKNAEKFIHPTKFTGNWPNWNGFAFLDWHKENNVYHPGEDYNFGYGDQDLGQDTNCTANGIVVHVSKRTTGYGNLIICKHNLGYNLRKFIKETYGIDTNKLYSLYAHLKDISVNVGDEIDCGQKIGTVGKSGTKWAHLHFEIFAPIGEIAKKAWRFYPVGWSKEKIKQFWLPAYQFIESTKNIESYENFLGKSKEYWLQVEKDRIDLLKQIGQCDYEWAKKLEIIEKENQQSAEKSAKEMLKAEKSVISAQNEINKLTDKIEKLEKSNRNLKTEVTQLLENNAKNIKFMSALKLVAFTISNMFKGGESEND